MVEYPDKELTEKIIGAAFEVHNTLEKYYKPYQIHLCVSVSICGPL
jgi:hypothetical protein